MVRHRARLPPPAPMPSGLSKEIIPAYPGAVNWASRQIQPPSGEYVSLDDQLIVSWWSSVNPTLFEVRGRLLGLNGIVTDIRVVAGAATGNARQQQQVFQPLAPGFLLDLAVFPSAGIFTTRGQCFVSIGLGRGPAPAPYGNRVLIQGYLENFIALQYPGSPIQGFLDGAGFLRFVHGTNPFPSITSAETVPTGARWRLQSYWIVVTTDATVGNRQGILILISNLGVDTILECPALVVQTASQNLMYVFSSFSSPHVIQGHVIDLLLQPELLKAGDQIFFGFNGVGAADALSAPRYVVEEWLQP